MLQLIRENFIYLQENIWTSTAMFGLFVVSVVCLAFDRNRLVRRLICYSILITGGVAYNYPLYYGVIAKIYPPREAVQLRLFWLAPCFLIIAFFLVKLISYIKKRWVMIAAAMCSVVFIWWAGEPFHPDVVVKRSNWYKISQEAIDFSELILKDMKEYPDNLAQRPTVFEASSTDVNDDITVGNAFHYGIRQYTSDFTLAPVLISDEVYTAEGFNIIDYYHEPSQYLVCEKGMTEAKKTAMQYGYHEVAEVGNHDLFRYARNATVYLVIRGQTLGDTSGELRGISGDSSLTTSGWWQTLKVGRALQDVKFSYAYVSSIGQSKITAGIILRENKNRDAIPAVTATDYLNDMSWGAFEGIKKADAIQYYGIESMDNGTIRDASFVSPYGIESRFNTVSRFKSAMGDSVKRLEEDGLNILIVANPSISWWLKTVTDSDDIPDLKAGEYVKLQFLDGLWSVAE